MTKKKMIIGALAAVGTLLVSSFAYSTYKIQTERNKVFEKIYADADAGKIAVIKDTFFTAKEIEDVLNSNHDLLVMGKKNPPSYAVVNINKLEKLTPERKKLIQENILKVPLEKGIHNITEKDMEEIKEVCGNNCFIMKQDDSTLNVSSDYKRKKILEKNKEVIAENAQGIIDYLKQDYNVEIRLDAGIINFVKGNHLSPEDIQLVVDKSKEDKNIKVLELEHGIDKITKKEINKMRDLCGNGCIAHLLDNKRISIISFF